MPASIATLLTRNLQDVFGENDADMPVPAHPPGGTESGASASSRPLEGSCD